VLVLVLEKRGWVAQFSHSPALAGFEDDDEDENENEAPFGVGYD
jgi:hypothetical protein